MNNYAGEAMDKLEEKTLTGFGWLLLNRKKKEHIGNDNKKLLTDVRLRIQNNRT